MNPYAKCKTGKQNRNERNKRKDVTSNTYVLKSIFDGIKIYGIKIDMVSNIGLDRYILKSRLGSLLGTILHHFGINFTYILHRIFGWKRICTTAKETMVDDQKGRATLDSV